MRTATLAAALALLLPVAAAAADDDPEPALDPAQAAAKAAELQKELEKAAEQVDTQPFPSPVAPPPAAADPSRPDELVPGPARAALRALADLELPPAIGPDGADPQLLRDAAKLFGALHRGDAPVAAELCRAPFQLEAERLATDAELKKRLVRLLDNRPLATVPLYGVEVMPAAAMVEKHGAPPARLGAIDLKDAWIAIANVGGKAVVAVFRREARGWRALALTD